MMVSTRPSSYPFFFYVSACVPEAFAHINFTFFFLKVSMRGLELISILAGGNYLL